MKLEVTESFYSAADVVYVPGDILELIEPTGRNPFKAKMVENHNWLVKCKFFSPPDDRAVWCHIPYALEKGFIKVVR